MLNPDTTSTDSADHFLNATKGNKLDLNLTPSSTADSLTETQSKGETSTHFTVADCRHTDSPSSFLGCLYSLYLKKTIDTGSVQIFFLRYSSVGSKLASGSNGPWFKSQNIVSIVYVNNQKRATGLVLWFPDKTSVCTHPWHQYDLIVCMVPLNFT